MSITPGEPLFFYRGRVALHCILRALGLGPGSNVALQAFTCTAVPEAIMASGASPKYVDIEDGGVNMSPASLKSALRTGIDAVVLQHTYGVPAEVEEIEGICDGSGVPLIEDCCHVLDFCGRGLGTSTEASFFSFEWGKPIPVGVGGAAVAHNSEMESKLLSFAAEYSSPSTSRRLRLEIQYHLYRLLYTPKRYWMLRKAFRALSRLNIAEGNYHRQAPGQISEEFSWFISAPVRARVQKARSRLADRKTNILQSVRRYRREINNPLLQHLIEQDACSASVLARYPLFTEKKSDLLTAAESYNVEVAGWYASAVHPFEGDGLSSVEYANGSCPNAERAAKRIVSLPIQNTCDVEIQRIVSFLNRDW